MNKKYISIALIVVLAIVAYSPVVRAEEGADDVEVRASSSIRVQKPGPINTLRERAVLNQNERNERLDERKDSRETLRGDLKNTASSTKGELRGLKGEPREDRKEDKKAIMMKMRKEVFTARKNNIVRQLNISIDNLTNISTRLAARIEKAKTSGRDMTEASALLVTANTKIATAKANIATLATLSATSSMATSTATTSAEVDLAKPRALAETATKSIQDAREALKKVVRSIAHNMGLKLDKDDNVITATTTATTSTTVGTTTATTTVTATTTASTTTQ